MQIFNNMEDMFDGLGTVNFDSWPRFELEYVVIRFDIIVMVRDSRV